MSSKDTMLIMLDLFVKRKEYAETTIVNFIKNKKISLNDRWDVFSEASNSEVYRKEASSYIDFKTILSKYPNFNWYDSFYVERRQVVDLVNIVDNLEASLIEALDPEISYMDLKKLEQKQYLTSDEEINQLKEEVLQLGYTHFVFDW